MNADGAGAARITNTLGVDAGASWDPWGSLTASAQSEGSDMSRLRVVEMATVELSSAGPASLPGLARYTLFAAYQDVFEFRRRIDGSMLSGLRSHFG